MENDSRDLLWLKRVRNVSHLLATERDLSKLLPLILDAAVELTEAERGFLVLVQGQTRKGGYRIKVVEARGFDQAALQSSRRNVSRTVVRRVLETDQGLVTTRDEDKDVLEVSSVQARRVLAIICVPMRLRGEVRGVLYLDHRFEQAAFTERDLQILQTFADQAALALETGELLAARCADAERLGKTLNELNELRALHRIAPDPNESADMTPLPAPVKFGLLVGESPEMAKLYRHIERAARSWAPVLILGDSGTGKELVAREIHRRGSYPRAPFLTVNCAAVAESLLETELFGHVRGAFTGATCERPGLFVQAGQGTLLLDEVGDMSPAMQAHLLRVLQEGCVRPVGGAKAFPIACRVLASTHHDLRALVDQGKFREDIYFRLDVLRITVPPLRKRASDIPLLFQHFLEQAKAPNLRLSPRAQKLLLSYTWPGNIRELQNEALRLASVGETRISGKHLSDEIRDGRGVSRAGGQTSGKTLGEVERDMVLAALRECGGNKSRAARQLGIPRSTLYNLLERHGL